MDLVKVNKGLAVAQVQVKVNKGAEVVQAQVLVMAMAAYKVEKAQVVAIY